MPLSAPNALGLHPSEPYSFRVIEEEFPLPFPLWRFPKKPFGLISALQRLDPTRKAVPLNASQRISLGRGPLLSWAFSSLEYFPPPFLPAKHLPLQAPLPYLNPVGLTTCKIRNPRVSLTAAWLSPCAQGANPSDVCHLLSSATG